MGELDELDVVEGSDGGGEGAPPQRPLVILDLGGVVVDESASHVETARRAAQAYLREICMIEGGDRLITDERVRGFAALPGMDTHLALAFALLYNLLTALPPSLRPPPGRPRRAREVRKAFKRVDLRLGMLMGLAERNIDEELAGIEELGGGMDGLRRYYRRDVIEGYLLHTGEIDVAEREAALPADATREERGAFATREENVLLRLCEEVFLGDAVFESVYGIAPWGPRGAGVVLDESLLFQAEHQAGLSELAELALLANRPPVLVERTLARHGLTDLFPVWETPVHEHTAVRRGEWMTVQPATIERLIQRAGERRGEPWPLDQVFLVVDSISDVEAGVAAGLSPIGMASPRLMRRQYREAGARTVIGRLDTLIKGLRKGGAGSVQPG